ncbi:double-strand break repair helicase AddA [Roseovarius sp. SYSU LYC5161]|uniref:double-strand break repair helicase AddA n=1 Tax=Roseovarius halophilus (ex Wu et al. 2025) TaxID=3376060 RepID=UPI00399AC725
MIRDDATQRQIDAAQPARSTWLAANAGSGKTRVLTDRVARLLLDGVDPQHILCLTYTKAAASEMQNRLFRRLGAWAMLADDRLRDALHDLGVEGAVSDDTLRDARRLFARAIETPGGLKIQTIHSFCAALLRRFPLEARVSPQFAEMEERTATRLRAEIVEHIAESPEAPVLDAVARHFTGESLDELTAEITRHRTALQQPPDHGTLAGIFGQPAEIDPDTLTRHVFLGDEQDLLNDLVPALLSSGANDRKAGETLSQVTAPSASSLPMLEDVFLLKSGDNAFEPKLPGITRQPFPTKALRKTLGPLEGKLDDWMRRVAAARETRLALAAIDKTRALHEFAALFLKLYDREKQARGLLDFDDLILRARDLLTDPDVAAWVLFRLDGGLDHILVDEAQDTSPEQWQVIERLTQEFTSGEGARPDVARTIFVVGDKKQSIYSFQGADPGAFDRMRADFAQRLSATGPPLQQLDLEYSFRSSHAVLYAVDATFDASGGGGFGQKRSHKAFKQALPGRVDLWPVIEKPEKEEEPEWFTPVDVKANNDPAILLARHVADTIRDMVDHATAIPDEKSATGFRAVQPGDFLILVQRRSDLFHELIRECKNRALPIAGADRLKLGTELGVRDIAALLSFLATPEDSLSLATALKSPLFGWSEADLYDLAQGRHEKYLWTALRNRAEDFPETLAILRDLLDQADYLRPYDLIERVLTRHDGRRRLLARLGPEAEDGIDALLSQAMAYEARAVDSLTGFLVWLESDDPEIKRQLDSAGNRIRVMTVHGAKGLEAPVVILPDTAQRPLRNNPQLGEAGGTALWRMPKEESPSVLTEVTDHIQAAERAERDRLLYVAMTRAEKWLIVGAAGDIGTNGESWYSKINAGLDRAGAVEHDFALGAGLRLQHEDWAETGSEIKETPDDQPTAEFPGFLHQPAAPLAPRAETLSPSELGGAKALPGERGLDEDAAKRRGRQVHRLLEFLPQVSPDDWPRVAGNLLSRGEDAATGGELDLLLAEARAVLVKPTLQPLFDTDALAEVPVSATLAELGGRRVHGIIDRLLVRDDHVLAVDFKTNAMVPDTPDHCPEGLLRQMGAYAAALAQIYPDRAIRTALLWTRTATLMRLPHDRVTKVLQDTPPA